MPAGTYLVGSTPGTALAVGEGLWITNTGGRNVVITDGTDRILRPGETAKAPTDHDALLRCHGIRVASTVRLSHYVPEPTNAA